MEPIKTAVLKNHLSTYLQRVRKGARFLVMDRNQPIAKLVPIDEGGAVGEEEKLASLIKEGMVEYHYPQTSFSSPKKIKLSGDVASQILIGDRE